jgi:hypothetical protein
MTKKLEALKLALEALEQLDGIDTETECVTIDVGDVMNTIKEALAQPAQEPVAWRRREVGGSWQYFGWEEAGMTYQCVERWNKNGFECEAIPRFAGEKNT